MNNSNFLEDLVSSSISKIEELAQSKTIIGEPITITSGKTIIPISKVSIGYVVGGGEYNSVNKKLPYPTCGGSGGGVSITPIGFIVETEQDIKFIDVENKTAYQTILNLFNTVLSKVKKNPENNYEPKGMDNEKF